MDVAAIEPGQDFRKAMDLSVAACNVLLAVIGPEWLDAENVAGVRRLDDPEDFVRIELASGLRRDILVVPVLVRGARMPRADQLPDDLKDLAYRNAVELTHARWKSDMQVLAAALRPYIGDAAVEAPQALATNKEKEAAGPGEGVAGRHAAGGGQEPAVPASGVSAQMIERVSKVLAGYIGPIADVVVRRAAKQCASELDLCGMVSREIEAEADRVRFLKACRS